MHIVIAHTWDGAPARPEERVALHLARGRDALELTIDAPDHGDPSPPGPPGPTPGLWNFEVVELFVFGLDGDARRRYAEIELGPGGHHLVLELGGVRQVTRQGHALEFHARREGARWRGRARVPLSLLPPRPYGLNAHAIHGVGAVRRYLSARPAGGPRPDFHRPDVYIPIADALQITDIPSGDG